MKTAVILLDGAAGSPHESLGGRTALQVARMPSLDALASAGASGLLRLQPKRLLQKRSQFAASILWGKSGTPVPSCASLAVPAREGNTDEEEMSYALNWICIEANQVTGFPRVAAPYSDELLSYLKEGRSLHGYRITEDALDGSVWITFAEMPEGPTFHLPEKATGHAAFTDHPTPNNAAKRVLAFQRWIHELLDGHPLNARRADETAPLDRLPVNGVWLFEGGGRPDAIKSEAPSTTCLLTDSAWGEGLGRWSGSAVVTLSKGLTEQGYPTYLWNQTAWLKQIMTHDFLAVFVENGRVFGQYEEPLDSVRRLEALDRDVLQPVVESIRRLKPCRIWVLALPPPGSLSDQATAWQVPFCCYGEGISPDAATGYDEASCLKGRGGRLNEKEFLKLLNKERS